MIEDVTEKHVGIWRQDFLKTTKAIMQFTALKKIRKYQTDIHDKLVLFQL